MSRTTDWVQSNVNAIASMSKGKITAHELTDFQKSAVELLSEGFNTGIYNVSVNWRKVDWKCGHGVRFTIWAGGGLSTYDFNHLTRLVIAAHDRCIRLDIAPAGFGYFHVYMHPRAREADNMSGRHPTIEQAIESFRGAG